MGFLKIETSSRLTIDKMDPISTDLLQGRNGVLEKFGALFGALVRQRDQKDIR